MTRRNPATQVPFSRSGYRQSRAVRDGSAWGSDVRHQRADTRGEDVTDMLKVIPGRWKVLQTVREKFTCRHCEKLA